MRDAIPPLTRGHLLIDQLVQAVVASVEHPRNRRLLNVMADRRKKTEQHMTRVERKAGVYVKVKGYPKGTVPAKPRPSRARYPKRGYQVFQSYGEWFVALDGSMEDQGPYERRADARAAGVLLVASLA